MRNGFRALLAVSLAAFAAFVASPGAASAAVPGDPDTSFDLDGFVAHDFGGDPFATSVVQQGNKVLVGGHTGYASFMMSGDFALARYNDDGSLDTTFNPSGPVPGTVVNPVGSSTETSAEIALLGDGKILQVGTVDGAADPNPGWFGLARYDANGVLDTTFDADGEVTTQWPGFERNTVYGMDVDEGDPTIATDDKYVVVGRGSEDDNDPAGVTGVRRVLIARYDATGLLDTSFGGDGRVVLDQGEDPWGVDVVVQSSGKVVVGGSVGGANPGFFVARLEGDGDLDTGFAGGGFFSHPVGTAHAEPFDLIAQPDGKLLLSGRAGDDVLAIARYSPDGVLDETTFGGGDGVATTALPGTVFPQPYELRVQSDGRILVGGTILDATTYLHQFMLARFTSGGALDTTFGGGDGWVATAHNSTNTHGRAMTIQSDGKLVVAGAFEHTGQHFHFAVARYLNDLAPAGAPAVTISPTSWDFGDAQTGQKSAAKTFTVSNSGSAPLDITGLSIYVPFEPTSGQTCTAMTLDPGEHCDLPLRFAPSAAGKVGPSQYVQLTTNATPAVHSITLAGNGTNPPPPADTAAPQNVTLTTPADRSVTGDPSPTFAGTAGTASGDSTTIHVDLERERSGGGFDPIPGTTATRSGGSWSVELPRNLDPGRYYARARQADAAGNESASAFVLFTVAGKPVNVLSPQMSGPEADIGVKLGGGVGAWTGGGNFTYYGVWMRCADTVVGNCKAIPGAGDVYPRTATYEITRDDVGFRILWAVLAANEAGWTVAHASHFTRPVPVPTTDTDADGLTDFEETGPIDWDGDGDNDVNLAEYGADPRHRDLFVEVDNMKTRSLRQDAVDIAVRTFELAPFSNPDGTRGITLHVDNGPDSIMNPRTGEKWGSRSESKKIADRAVIVTGGTWGDFDDIKTRDGNFTSGRQTTFRYVINGFRHTAAEEGSSGKARAPESDFRGSDMVVTLAGVQCDPGVTGCGDTETAHAGTFLHELGHLLGSRHGGGDNTPNKPNYLSVMNYDFQFFGLRNRTTNASVFDYSRWDTGGSDYVANINENALHETSGIRAGGTADAYTTLIRCWKTTGEQVITRTRFNVALDFNCNGSKADGALRTGVHTNPDGVLGTLDAYDDWENMANLKFEGGWVDRKYRFSAGGSRGPLPRRSLRGAKSSQASAFSLPDLPDKVALQEPPPRRILEATRVLAGDAKKPTIKVTLKKRKLTATARDNKALDQIRVTVGKTVYVGLPKAKSGKRAKLVVKLKTGKRRIVAVAIDWASNGSKPVKLRPRIK